MKSKRMRLFAAVAVICALAAGGAAFTASNTLPGTDVAGYGSVTVSGATVSSIHNNLDTTGANITSVDLVFSASQAGLTVQSQFGDESGLDTCTDSDPGTDKDWNCPVGNGSGPSGAEPTTNATSYHVAVSQ